MLDDNVRILVVDDDEDDFVIVKDLLSEISYTRLAISWEPDFGKANKLIEQQDFDIYLIDYRLGEKNGLELLKNAVEINRNKPVIMLTGQGETAVDIEAMQIGAADFLVKDRIDAMTIERSIRYALSNARAMYKLYEQEEKYRTLFEQSVSAILILDNQLCMLDINRNMWKLTGYSVFEISGKSPAMLFAREDGYQKLVHQLDQYGYIENLETQLKHKNNQLLLINISVTPFLDSEENVKGYQAIIEDISERKKVQQELIQLEKLIMTGNIARSIAHEVRNPLTNISLSLEQFTSEMELNEEAEVYIDIIRRNTKRINQLISEMLKSSKPSELKLEPTHLNMLLEKVLSMAKDRVKLQEIKLVKTYDDHLPAIPLDQEKLPLAILNIVNNALEAVEPRKGILSLQTCLEGGHQVLRICDNGPGIPQNEVSRLFDAFHTSKKGGMGLGLTFTQNIINSHGAKIAVESTIDKGTCFIMKFNNQTAESR